MGTMGLALPWEVKITPGHEGYRLPALCRNDLGHLESPVQPKDAITGLASRSASLSPDEMALAMACRSGDLGAFERLYHLYGGRMKSIARNLLGSQSDAEDAVQDTFLKIQRSIHSFRGQSSLATWSFRILVNTCYDARRRRMRKKEVAQEEHEDRSAFPEPRAPVAHPSLRLALERALAQLTRHQRDVFLLYEVEGFRHSEIAAVLDISETASKNTLFQAKKSLRQMLEAPRGAAEAR